MVVWPTLSTRSNEKKCWAGGSKIASRRPLGWLLGLSGAAFGASWAAFGVPGEGWFWELFALLLKALGENRENLVFCRQ